MAVNDRRATAGEVHMVQVIAEEAVRTRTPALVEVDGEVLLKLVDEIRRARAAEKRSRPRP